MSDVDYWERWMTDDEFAMKFDPDGIQLPHDDYLADDIATQWMFDNWDKLKLGNLEIRQLGEARW